MFALPYLTTGSGSLAAMAILETFYKENLEREDAIKLVVAAIDEKQRIRSARNVVNEDLSSAIGRWQSVAHLEVAVQ